MCVYLWGGIYACVQVSGGQPEALDPTKLYPWLHNLYNNY